MSTKVQIGERYTTTEPLGLIGGDILPTGTVVTVTDREPRGWTVTTDDGRTAPWVASVQLGVDATGDSPSTGYDVLKGGGS